MKLQFLSSACVKIIENDTKILCDPWLIDGEYYGSWSHYPPYNFNEKDFNDIDSIYISHQHPDHFSPKTLEKLSKKIPIYIHRYHYKFLKSMIEELGFRVIELNHNERIHIKNNLHLNILAADNCNPELCYRYFGCGVKEKPTGSTYNDTMCVIDNTSQVIVNTNDCPFPLAQTTADIIKNQYKKINLLLVGYNSAGPYPQCFEMEQENYQQEKNKVKNKFFTYAENYINLLKPKYYLPFAGRYVLSGKNHILNDLRATVELEDAFDYLSNSQNIDHKISSCIVLNSNSIFDLDKNSTDSSYTPINIEEKRDYIKNVLSKVEYDFEKNITPDLSEIEMLIEKSFKKFENARNNIQFTSDTVLLLQLPQQKYLSLHFNGNGYQIIDAQELLKFSKFVKIDVDSRLLKLLLQGPRYANWNNCEVGSHLRFKRNPNIYENGLFYCLNFLHN
tara:strand:- start:2753 stop:4096 length:1344 start_codon:yes stop_codon:yes gene_type:complete